MITSLASNSALKILARIAQIAVALVFALAAGLKALDPVGFAGEIAGYNLLPALAPIAAWAFLVAEFMLVAALAINAFPRVTHTAAILLLLLFIGVTIHGMLGGGLSECGCFGNLIKRGPVQVIIEDSVMILLLLFASLILNPQPPARTRWKLPVVLLGGALIAGTALISPSLPVDNIVTDLKPGAFIPQWPIEGLPIDVAQRTHLVVIFDGAKPSTAEDLRVLGPLAEALPTLSLVGLTISGTSSAHDLQYGLGLPCQIGALEPRFARRLYRTLPRSFLIHEGRIEAVWQGLPDSTAIMSALRSIPLDATEPQ